MTDFFGVKLAGITRTKALNSLEKKQIIYTPNPEILLEARKDKKYTEILNRATILLPDGHGLLFVSTLLKFHLFWRIFLYFPALILFLFYKKPFKKTFPELIHGSDFMRDIIKWANDNKKSIFFLGSSEASAKGTSQYFQKKYPDLTISYSSKDPGEITVEEIGKSDVLFVAYGAPKQEKWIDENKNKVSAQIIMGVGGSFDFYSGTIKRAPAFFRKLGLEWLWRLILQPKRIKRIYNALIKFPLICVFSSPRSVSL